MLEISTNNVNGVCHNDDDSVWFIVAADCYRLGVVTRVTNADGWVLTVCSTWYAYCENLHCVWHLLCN